jgi:hypothetical protein
MSIEAIREIVNRFMDMAEEAYRNGQTIHVDPKAEVVTVGEEGGWAKKAFSGRMEMRIVIESPGVHPGAAKPGFSITAPR